MKTTRRGFIGMAACGAALAKLVPGLIKAPAPPAVTEKAERFQVFEKPRRGGLRNPVDFRPGNILQHLTGSLWLVVGRDRLEVACWRIQAIDHNPPGGYKTRTLPNHCREYQLLGTAREEGTIRK